MPHRTTGSISLALALVLVGCGDKDAPAGPAPAATETANPEPGATATPEAPAPAASPLATARGSLAHQFALLKAQKVDELRACFTARQQERITAEAVAKAQGEVGAMTMDDLYAAEEPGEYEGKQTMKVKMKNGRTLTTLVLTDGRWLSDTVWFR